MAFGFNTRPQGGQQELAAPRSTPPTEMEQSSGFTEVLKQPEVQAALIQFGINMLNPTYDGFGGQLGRSIGAAGAAAGRAVGQKQEREEVKQRQRFKEAELGLAERRVKGAERRENRLSRGGGLSSMFSKPKNFPQFLHDQAELASDASFGDVDPLALQNDPKWRDEQYQLWLELNRKGMSPISGSAGGGKPSQAAVMAEARARIAAGQDRDTIIRKMQADGYDTSGL